MRVFLGQTQVSPGGGSKAGVWGQPGQWAPEALVGFRVTTPSFEPRRAWHPASGSLRPRLASL